MYLKSIEIHGFKSFANRIKMEFHNGRTGIVGPNGSGKSNVADAVRWVLGEQKVRQLRGMSMQDVIFQGTELRKPMSYAYVAITLDNADHSLQIDYPEVTVARRLYRSGESEYLINQSPCRLKDINELFYDTGIGKEGYSIIGQGQIERILSGKPDERRELFDEAAGIVKFKHRKEASIRKLEHEEANLVRLNDILSELTRQVEPLEKQSEKAKIYLARKEELKKLDVNVFLLDNEKTNQELKETREKHSDASSSLEKMREEYDDVRSRFSLVQGRLDELDRLIEEERNSISRTSDTRSKLENQRDILKEQVKALENNIDHLKNRVESLNVQMDERRNEERYVLEEAAAIEVELVEITDKNQNLSTELEKLRSEINEMDSAIQEAQNAVLKELERRSELKGKRERLGTTLEQKNIRSSEIASRLVQAKTHEQEQDDAIQRLEAEFKKVCDVIINLNDDQKAMETRLNQIKTELSEEDGRLREAQERFHRENSRLEAIENIAQRYDGYGNSVRMVMEQKNGNPGIIGVVADIIKVEAKYEVAIETALGGSIQNIVTEDGETAKNMIAFLKRTKGGRATFLPLTDIGDDREFKDNGALGERGVLGLAHTLVSTENRYYAVAASLLGRILVVDNMDNAMAIARKYRHSIRMVTLEGELITPGGAISGGAFKNQSNLLGRRRELDELEEKIKKIKTDIADGHKKIEDIKVERNQLRIDLEKKKAELQERFIEQNTARMNVLQAKEKRDSTLNDTEMLGEEAARLKEEMEQIRIELQETDRELSESSESEKNYNDNTHENQRLLDDLRDRENELLSVISELNVSQESVKQRQIFQQQNLDRIQGEIGGISDDLRQVETEQGQSEKEIVLKREQIDSIEETIGTSFDVQEESRTKLTEFMNEKETLSGEQKNYFSRRDALNEELNSLEKEVVRLDSQRERLEESLERQFNYMWDEYQITLSDCVAMRDEELTDLDDMKRQIGTLRADIRQLGDVNVNAIEEYRELMERYTFLKGQYDDLVGAKETLQGIITDLDEAMRKQFKEEFARIDKEFNKVFGELFGGGKASVSLTDNDDILEAGIIINAQPPGKKLQNMMQLSGGEKSLTAISLLFAIQNLKPSPFCLLDEIEAALDDSNVARFADYLKKLTDHTQFIMITHRRGTMDRCDRLYGITMQEKGVSVLVSVNLIEKDLDD